MIQTETKIHRHGLSVALAKARFFRCHKTHVDCTWCQKKRSRKEEEEYKNKEEHKNITMIQYCNNKRKEEQLTLVSLIAQASLSFTYETLIFSKLHK